MALSDTALVFDNANMSSSAPISRSMTVVSVPRIGQFRHAGRFLSRINRPCQDPSLALESIANHYAAAPSAQRQPATPALGKHAVAVEIAQAVAHRLTPDRLGHPVIIAAVDLLQ